MAKAAVNPNQNTQQKASAGAPNNKSNSQTNKNNESTNNSNVTVPKYTITCNLVTLTAGQDNPVNELTSDLVGATLTVTNPHTLVNTTQYPTSRYTLPTTFETTITKVVNDKVFEIDPPYYIYDQNTSGIRIPVSLKTGNVSITYNTYKTITTDETYKRSYADLTIGNLRTYSGDVYKAKIYTRDHGVAADYQQIYENYVIPENQLVDESSTTGYDVIGFFHTQDIIDNYWISSSTAGDTGQFVTRKNNKLIDAVEISGSVYNINDTITFRTKNANTLERKNDYVVRFNTYYFKELAQRRDSNSSTSEKRYASLKMYLSGSAITGQNGEPDYYLGKVDIPDSAPNEGLVENVIGMFTTPGTGTAKTWLKFELNAGRFHIQDVSIEPYSERNFNPNFFNAFTPMPKPVKRDEKYDFLVEFYDSNNNLALTKAETLGVTFKGSNDVVGGLDNHLEGAINWGGSMEAYGVSGNSAYLRTLNYKGFQNTLDNGLGGFMMFSGSIGARITASEASGFEYDGVGLEIVDGGAADGIDRYLRFRTKPSIFEVVTDSFFLGQNPASVPNGSFISGSNGKLQISSSNFSVDATGNVTMSGFLSASGGHLGNFRIVDGKISGSNITMDANNSTIYKTDQGPGSDTSALFPYLRDEYYIDFTPTEESPDNYYIKMGPNFMVDKDGILIASGATFVGTITASAGLIGGFTVGSASLFNGSEATPNFFFSGSATGTDFNKGNLFISSSGFQVNSQGAISASSGEIGGWTLSSTTLTGGTITLDSSGIIEAGGLTGISDTTNTGFYVDNSGQILIRQSATDFLKFSGGSLDLNASLFNLRTGNLIITDESESAAAGKIVISGTDQHIKVGTGVSIDGDGDSNTGQITVGSGKVVLNGNSDSSIAGWTIGTTTISKNNMIISSEGFIQSSGYSSGVIAGNGNGFILTAEGGGYLEVEKARIRGTLTTAVFEKETVNAVGGMLMVANSTIISESVGASDTTMSVENVSGFTGSYNGFTGNTLTDISAVDGEILLIKKVDNTGFTTEYVLVQSASFRDPTAAADGTDPSGYLYVTRSFGGANSGTGDSSSPTKNSFATEDPAQAYTPGQVIASTGKYISGTGDNTVGTGYIFMNANPNDQYSPYIDIVERTGSKVYDMDLKVRLGDLTGLSQARLLGTNPADAGFGLYAENAFLEGGIISRYGSIGGFNMDSTDLWAGNSDKSNTATKIVIGDATDGGTPKIALGTQADSMGVSTGNSGVYMDGSGNFRVGGTSNNFIKFTGGTLSIDIDDIDISSTTFELDATELYISSANQRIALGADGSTLGYEGTGIFLGEDGSGIYKFSLKSASGDSLSWDGAGQLDIIGNITADGGTIGGWTLSGTQLSGTNAILKSSGVLSLGSGTDNYNQANRIYIDGSTSNGRMSIGTGFRYASNALTIDGNATIGGWTINGSTITGGNVTLNSAGIIEAGGLTGISDTSNTGFYVDNTGQLLVRQSPNDFMKFSGGTLDLNATIMKVYATSSNAGIIMDSTTPLIMVTGSRGSVTGNSVKLLGDEGVIEVSQSGQGVFDTGRTKTFTTEYIVKTDSVKPATSFVKEVDSNTELPHTITRTTTTQAAPKLLNVEVENSVDAGIVKTDKLFVTSPTGNSGTNIYMNTERDITTLNYNGATNPTASYYFGNNVDYSFSEVVNANLHPGFHYHYHVSNSVFVGAEQPVGFVQGGVASGSSIFTISTAMVSTEDDDFADAKFNILALDANTSGLGAARQNEYTFLQARHSGSIRAQLQHDGDFVSKGNITAFGTTFLQVSDRRLKKDIHTISGSMDKILQLRPTEFVWIDNDKQDVGFIAQEVEEIIPEVIEISDGFINTGNDQQIKTISYPKLVPYLVDTIQQLTKRIEELEKKVK